MNRVCEMLIDLFFPPKCPFCGKVLDRVGVCPACEKKLPRVPEGEERETDGELTSAAPFLYEGMVREVLLRLKFQGGAAVAEPLGLFLAQCAAEQFSGEFDTVTWVPVSQQRLRERGYDQSRLLAEAACRQWGIKPVKLLEKTRHNPAQSGLESAAARKSNVAGVYTVPDPAAVAGKQILLIDDIHTTGATLSECARMLREHGAASVLCLTAARTQLEKNVENS